MTYVDILRNAFAQMWAGVILFIPKFLLAVIIFCLTLLVAGALKAAVVRMSALLHLDELLEKLELKSVFAKAGVKLQVGEFLGWLVKWFVIVLGLIVAADALGWAQITTFLTQVVNYLPNVVISVVILLVGVLLANFVNTLVISAVKAAEMQSAEFLAGLAKWSIIVFSFMAALSQLGIAEDLIQSLFTGFVAMVAIAGGLAFGLGGREHASKILNKLEADLTSKNSSQS